MGIRKVKDIFEMIMVMGILNPLPLDLNKASRVACMSPGQKSHGGTERKISFKTCSPIHRWFLFLLMFMQTMNFMKFIDANNTSTLML